MMSRSASDVLSPSNRSTRVDLHCHSIASTEADEAVLIAINCPECYSEPTQVYAQAKRRGMDFVTITDHDSIEGVKTLVGSAGDVIVGEEVTCYFPEDHCKMHILVWGIDDAHHAALQQRAEDVYAVAAYIEEHRLAHAVAHPVYRQNDLLDRWHLERLFLIFKGFECLNGAHSMLHRDSVERMLDELSPRKMAELSAQHEMPIRWGSDAWRKSRTGGSDDHGLLNIGRTWTEFPADVRTRADVLDALRDGRCRPGGEAGSSLKLAHNFIGVGIRYYTRNLAGSGTSAPTMMTAILESLIGDRPPLRKRDVVKLAVAGKLHSAAKRVLKPFSFKRAEPTGTALVSKLLIDSFKKRAAARKPLTDAMRNGDAPLGEHDAVFGLLSELNRDIVGGIVASLERATARGDVAPMFDSLGAIAAHQFAQLPYYFALFHQNRERHLLPTITRHRSTTCGKTLRVALFTDSFGAASDAGRLARQLGRRALDRNLQLTIVTCAAGDNGNEVYRKNFEPMVERQVGADAAMRLVIPPVTEILEWADRQQFDAIHILTPGPVGLVGLLAAKMLRAPAIASHLFDLPKLVELMTGDYRLGVASQAFSRWFYSQFKGVVTQTRLGRTKAIDHGADPETVKVVGPCVELSPFDPGLRSETYWARQGVREPVRILYHGRLGREHDVQLIAEAFKTLSATRKDVALIFAGQGPEKARLSQQLKGVRAYFFGEVPDSDRPTLFASCDLLLNATRIDGAVQSVIEAQASGLPVLVSQGCGLEELMDHDVSGLALPPRDVAAWTRAIAELLDDDTRRQRMGRNGAHRISRFTNADPFDLFWRQHAEAVLGPSAAETQAASDDADELAADRLVTQTQM